MPSYATGLATYELPSKLNATGKVYIQCSVRNWPARRKAYYERHPELGDGVDRHPVEEPAERTPV